jgi:hypothetical protein
VVVRSTAFAGIRRALIVDLSATGARIDGLAAPEGVDVQLTFNRTHRRAKVMRSADGEGGPWVGVAFVDAHASPLAEAA